ncbi:TPA: hypothetical protein ACKQC7_004868 [Serratia marcescens]
MNSKVSKVILPLTFSLLIASGFAQAENDPKCKDYKSVMENTCWGSNWQDGSAAACVTAQAMFAALKCGPE